MSILKEITRVVRSGQFILVKRAREKGLRASTGEGMLANQGALSFEKWTGKPLGEIKLVIRKALMDALKRTNN